MTSGQLGVSRKGGGMDFAGQKVTVVEPKKTAITRRRNYRG